MKHQNIITGLFPSDDDPNISHLGDSLFCSYALWGLSEGYKRFDSSNGLNHQLAHSAIKGMRGVLYCWMHQSDRVERFKLHQHIQNALNSTFCIRSGICVKQDDLFDRQIYITALFLIFVTQMITSGIEIIYSKDEVHFVQNLVYYIERSYRVSDFSIWGTDTNSRLHPCTIGIVKAALECCNGFNLYGQLGAPWAVLFVDVDAHKRNSNTFEALLDFEVNEFDPEILVAIGWPSFATHDIQLLSTVIQTLSANHPENIVLKTIDKQVDNNPQCAIFCMLMMINGIFWRNDKLRTDYLSKLYKYTSRLFSTALLGSLDLPMDMSELGGHINNLRFVDKPIKMNLIIHSLHLLYLALNDNIIHRCDLDPQRRYLPGSKRHKRQSRYTSFQGRQPNMVIQIVQISETTTLQSRLLDFGIQSQTPSQICPIEIWNTSQIVKLFERLGCDSGLRLSGRVPRPFGYLSSSKVYKICGKTVICFPLMFEVDDFYLWNDAKFVINSIRRSLTFIGRSWKLCNRPLFCFAINESMLLGTNAGICLELLSQIKNGYVDGVKVEVGRIQNVLANSAIEYLDFVDGIGGFEKFDDVVRASPFEVSHVCNIHDVLTETTQKDHQTLNTQDLLDIFEKDNGVLVDRVLSVIELSKRKSTPDLTFEKYFYECHTQALYALNWYVMRLCSTAMCRSIHSLAPMISTILSYGKTVTIGVHGHKLMTIRQPTGPHEILKSIYDLCMPENPVQVSLQQEVLFNLGVLISDSLDTFNNIVNIQIGSFIQAMQVELDRLPTRNKLWNLSPSEIQQMIVDLLSNHIRLNEWKGLYRHMRIIDGLLGRIPDGFLHMVNLVLIRFNSGIEFQGMEISKNTISDGDTSLNQYVVQSLEAVQDPAYKQLIVETLTVVASFEPGLVHLSIKSSLKVDMIIDNAVKLYSNQVSLQENSIQMFDSFSNLPFYGTHGTGSYLVRSFMSSLASQEVIDIKDLINLN